MEQMGSNIHQNTDNAKQTENISRIAKEGMESVARSSEESLISVREISDKIQIINDIPCI